MSHHFRYGPSSRERWRSCPGSVRLTHDINPPEETSPEASEGILAHAEAAECLQNNRDSNNAHVQKYLNYVRSLPGAIDVETTLEHPEIPGFGGTPDSIVYDFSGVLHVIDFKYGEGMFVDVMENPQLEAYAVLAAAHCPDIHLVEMTIVQPRAEGEPVRTAKVFAPMLDMFRRAIEQEIAACEAPDAPIVSGRHCQWCPVKAHCPALRSSTQLAVGLQATLPDPAALRDDQINWLLENEKRIADYLKAVYSHALQRALAGNPPAGWKAIPTLGNRRWKDMENTLKAVKRLGRKLDEVSPRVLLSPAQMEERAGIGREWIDIMTERLPGSPRLVPESDPRPGICALDNFEVEEKIDARTSNGE